MVSLVLMAGFLGVMQPSQAHLTQNVMIAHSGGLNAQGCHAGSQPYHCHRSGTSAPRARSGRRSSTTGDLDCADFGSWSAAQALYQNSGAGDPHRLDADNDGIACEALRR